MRTTVEITGEQHRALTALAMGRGLRGFSTLVQEAIDLYLAEQRSEHLQAALDLEGILTDQEAEEVRRRIERAWSTWSTPS